MSSVLSEDKDQCALLRCSWRRSRIIYKVKLSRVHTLSENKVKLGGLVEANWWLNVYLNRLVFRENWSEKDTNRQTGGRAGRQTDKMASRETDGLTDKHWTAFTQLRERPISSLAFNVLFASKVERELSLFGVLSSQ